MSVAPPWSESCGAPDLSFQSPYTTALSITCYYGVSDDGDDEPEDDWSDVCIGDATECVATCDGPESACFKARFGETIKSHTANLL